MSGTPEEERKFKKAEQACEAKYKRKLEADQRARGPYKKVQESAASNVNTPILGNAANGPQYVQFPIQALANGAQNLTGQVVQTMPANSNQVAGAANATAGGAKNAVYKRREIGPCFNCDGPHLVRNCPELNRQTTEVQNKIAKGLHMSFKKGA